jgi:hypothetical protein
MLRHRSSLVLLTSATCIALLIATQVSAPSADAGGASKTLSGREMRSIMGKGSSDCCNGVNTFTDCFDTTTCNACTASLSGQPISGVCQNTEALIFANRNYTTCKGGQASGFACSTGTLECSGTYTCVQSTTQNDVICNNSNPVACTTTSAGATCATCGATGSSRNPDNRNTGTCPNTNSCP